MGQEDTPKFALVLALSSKQIAHNWINVGSSPAKSAIFVLFNLLGG